MNPQFKPKPIWRKKVNTYTKSIIKLCRLEIVQIIIPGVVLTTLDTPIFTYV